MSFSEMGFYEWAVVAGIFLLGMGVSGARSSLKDIDRKLYRITKDVEILERVATSDNHPNTRHLEQIGRKVTSVYDFLHEYMRLRNQ